MIRNILILSIFLALTTTNMAYGCRDNWMPGYWEPDVLSGAVNIADIPPENYPQNYCTAGITDISSRLPPQEGCFLLYTSWSGHRHICEWYESSSNPCLEGTYWDAQLQQCVGEIKCPAGETLNYSRNACEKVCPENTEANDLTGKCEQIPEERDCNVQSNHPITFLTGEKLRTEPIISVGQRSPINLKYMYSNYRNSEKTNNGFISHPKAPRWLVRDYEVPATKVSTSLPLTPEKFSEQYNNNGIPLSDAFAENQYYGGMSHYWRHNYDEIIQRKNNTYTLHKPNGKNILFNGLGISSEDKKLNLEIITDLSLGFQGYKLENIRNTTIKFFDTTGRLRLIENGKNTISLTYNNENLLTRISNNSGDSLSFNYTQLLSNENTHRAFETRNIVSSITSSDGMIADLEWAHQFQGISENFVMLTKIIQPYKITPKSARDFSYTDTRWPASITAIHTVTDINQNITKPYAEFKYDNKGRAIYSSLANGAEAVTVNYIDELTRTVTNALGKDATYTFAMIDGVKRLKKVVGEPTTNCLQSEVEYIYNTDGSVFEKHQNGKVTRFTQYDNKGRELERTEAFGTPDARTIKTEWHPTLNVKTKVIEPKITTEWEYFDDGKLKTTKTYTTEN